MPPRSGYRVTSPLLELAAVCVVVELAIIIVLLATGAR